MRSEFSLLRRLSASALLLAGLGWMASGNAAEISISCTDVDDAQTCSVSGGAVSESLTSLVGDVLESLASPNANTELCQRNGNSAQCTLPGGTGLTFNCTIADDQQSGSCQLGQLPPEFFALDCSRADAGGACTFSTDDAAITSTLTPALGARRAGFATHLLAGCALRSGTDAFLRDCDQLLAALSAQDYAAVQRTLDTIIPANADITLDNTALQLAMQLDGVRSRLSRLRHGQRGADVAGLMFFDGLQWVSAGTLLAAGGDTMTDASPPVAGFADERLGVFIDGSIANTEFDASDNEGDADTDLQLLTLGIDYRISDQWIAGIAYSASFSSTDFGDDSAGNKRGDIDSNGYLLIAYGTWYQGDAYVDATLAYGADRFDQSRHARCNSDCAQPFDQQFEAEFHGDQFAATLGGGYEWRFGAMGLTPWLQLASIRLATDAYRETPSDAAAPGAGFALSIDGQDRDLLTASIGADLRYTISMAWGVLVPYLGVELINELDDDGSVVTGRFTGNLVADDGFTLATNEIDTSYALVGVGTTWQLAGNQGGYVDVKSLQGYDDLDQWRITAGWRVAF